MDNRMNKKSESESNKGCDVRPSTSCNNNVGMNICSDEDEDDDKEKENYLDESIELFMKKHFLKAKELKNSKKENKAAAKDVKKKQYVIINKRLQVSEVSTDLIGENFSQTLLDVDHLTEVKKCPLCFKVFENNILNHVKSCSVKNKLSTKQLFGAVKLQEKQDKEREAMGLPVLPQKPVPKRTVKRKLPTTGLGSSVDLAIALSKSLKEAEERALINEADLLSEAGLHEEATNTLQTLEKCGLSSQPTTSNCEVSSVKSKAAGLKQQRLSILLSRSEKERERITTEKVAMVLMEDDIKMEIDKNSFRKTRTPKSVKLKKCHKELNSLWNLATSKHPSEKLEDYYVESLGNVVSQSRTEPGGLLRHASQIPGRLGTPTSSGDARMVNLENDFPDPEDLLNRERTIDQTTVTSRLNNNNNNSNSNNNSNTNNRNLLMDNQKKFQDTFISNWKTMFRNKVCSDITVLAKDGQTIPVHRLVLYVRCKNILNSIVNNNDDSISSPYLIDWRDISHESASIFLKFLYCCEFIEDIFKLPRHVLDDLLTLIKKYNVKELEEVFDKSKANDRNVRNNEHSSVSKNNFKRNLFSENRVVNEQSCDEVNLNSEPNTNVLNSDIEACRSHRNEDELSDDSNSTVINRSLNFPENQKIKTKRISFENIKKELFNDSENEINKPKSDSNSDVNHRLPNDLKKSSISIDKQSDDTNYDSDTTVINQQPQNGKNVCQRKTVDKLHDDNDSDDSASTVINDVRDNHKTHLKRPTIKKSTSLSQDNNDYNLNKVQYYLNSIKTEDSNSNLNSSVNENVSEPSTSSRIVKNGIEGVRDSIVIEDDEDTMDNDGFNQVVKMVIENEIREPASSQNVSSQDIFSEFNAKKTNKDFHGALNESNRKLNVRNSNENFRGLLNRSNSKRKSSQNNDGSEVKRFCGSTSNETNLDSDGNENEYNCDNNMNETDTDISNYSNKNISKSNKNVNNILENECRIPHSNSAASVDEISIDPVWNGFDDIVNDCYDHFDPGTPGRKMGDNTFNKSAGEKLHINNSVNKLPTEDFMNDIIGGCTPHNFSDFDGTAPSTSKMTSSNSRLDNRIGVNSYFFEGISDFVPNKINKPTNETQTNRNSHCQEVTENGSSVKAKVTSETFIENDEPLSISDCSSTSSVICLSPTSNINTDNNNKEVKTKSKNSLLNDDLEIFDSTALLSKNQSALQNYENNSLNIDKENLNNSENNDSNYKDDAQSTPAQNNNNNFLSLSNSDGSIKDVNEIHESVKSATLPSLTHKKINKSSSVTNSPVECIITPRTEVTPDFKNMDETELKRRLGQYGLKHSLGAQKARKLLTFIYNQLHPELPEDTLSDYKKVKDVALNYCNANIIKPNDDVTNSSSIDKNNLSQIPSVSSTQAINDSSEKQHTNSEESDVVDSGDEDDGSSSSNSDVIEEVEIEDSSDESPNHRNCNSRERFQDTLKNYIRSKKELYHSILCYKVVQLKDIAHGLKASGCKFTLAELMENLDKEGVIYQTTSGYNLRKRRAVVYLENGKKEKSKVPPKKVFGSKVVKKTETDSSKTKKTGTRGKNLVDRSNAAGPSSVTNENHVDATQFINSVKKNLNKTMADNSTLTNGDCHNSLPGKKDRRNAEAAGSSSFTNETFNEITQFIDTIEKNFSSTKADNSTLTNGDSHNSLPEWSCDMCTFDNQSSAEVCEMCGHSRKKKDESTFKELMELEECQLIHNKETFECLICFSECLPGKGILLRNCLHMFCRECLINTIEFCEDPEVKCPFLDDICTCTFTIQEREIKNIVSPEAYERHLAKSLSIGENQMRDAFHCKTADCRGWCIIDELTAAENVNVFLCPICNACNCLPCQAIHTGMNCKEYQEDLLIKSETDVTAKKTLQFIQKMKKQKKAMNCPRCNILVMKTEGCDWIQCSMCRTDICWATLGPRWGPKGPGDKSAGCQCNFASGKPCHPKCRNCH